MIEVKDLSQAKRVITLMEVRIAELEQQRGKLLEALIHLHHNARASGAEMGLALDFASEAIAEVRGEK